MEAITDCFTCGVVHKYSTLMHDFVQSLSHVLSHPLENIFWALVGFWVVIQGIRLACALGDVKEFLIELFWIALAAVFLGGSGGWLVMETYDASLSVMGEASSVVMEAAARLNDATKTAYQDAPSGGMTRLAFVTEQGVDDVLQTGWTLFANVSWHNFSGMVVALAIVVPWFFLLIAYFSQIVVSIFRVMVLAGLSPILMMGMGFSWLRGMAVQALKSLLAAYMVLFGATLAVGMCLYAVTSVDLNHISDMGGEVTLLDPGILTVIMLGLMGSAFVAEATAIANSIANSHYTNTAVGVIGGGAMTIGGMAWTAAKWSLGAGLGAAAAGAGGAMAGGAGAAMASEPISPEGQAVLDRLARIEGRDPLKPLPPAPALLPPPGPAPTDTDGGSQ